MNGMGNIINSEKQGACILSKGIFKGVAVYNNAPLSFIMPGW